MTQPTTSIESEDNFLSNSTKATIKKISNVVVFIVAAALLYKLLLLGYTRKHQQDEVKKNSSCPTLLSISRSARDTLLVMRSESLCTQYVLDNIK